MLAYYFAHRQQLVIHADNVSQLLEERTVELRAAQAELAKQNDRLAERLAEQERDLRAKTEVIDRQRRLELAAQTAGQVAHDIQNMISPILSRIEELEEALSLDSLRDICASMRKQVTQLLDLNTISSRSRAGAASSSSRSTSRRWPGRCRTGFPAGGSCSNPKANPGSRDRPRSCRAPFPTCSPTRWKRPRSRRAGHRPMGHRGPFPEPAVPPGLPRPRALCDAGGRGPRARIPKEHLDKIFEPFFSSKGGRHRSGSGLGLTIVTAVMDDHKGVLDLETGSQGTRFTLYFPAIDPQPEAALVEKLSHSATVLVVDDDNSVLKEYGDLLKQTGYTVLSAESGAQAIRVGSGPAGGRDPARLQHAAHERARDLLRRDARAAGGAGGGPFELCH